MLTIYILSNKFFMCSELRFQLLKPFHLFFFFLFLFAAITAVLASRTPVSVVILLIYNMKFHL